MTSTTPAPGVGRLAALRDEWLMHSMLERVGDLPETVFVPLLRVVADDRAGVEEHWAALVAERRRRRGLFETPQNSWRRQYRQFVRELEWSSGELLRVLPWPAVEELVSDAVAGRLRGWLRYLLPVFNLVPLVPKAIYPTVLDMGVSLSTFLVGPIHRTGTEPDGTLVYEIPACAMHTCVSAETAQEASCRMGCKAACEKVFPAGGPMPLEFDPHLPGLGCTLRVRAAH